MNTNNDLSRISELFGDHIAKEVVGMGYVPSDAELFKIKREIDEQKNFDFTQINNKYTWDVIAVLAKENPNALQLLMFLGKNMDKFNAVSCSQALLCEVLGKGRTTVHNTIKYLEKHQYISIGKQGNNNIYILNDTLFWKNKRTHHKYCQFSGSILLSRSENAKLFEKLEKSNELEFSITKAVSKKDRKN